MALALHAQNSPGGATSRASAATVAEWTGLARRTVHYALADLRAAGYLHTASARPDGRPGNVTGTHALCIPAPAAEPQPPADSPAPEPPPAAACTAAPDAPVHDMHGGSASGALPNKKDLLRINHHHAATHGPAPLEPVAGPVRDDDEQPSPDDPERVELVELVRALAHLTGIPLRPTPAALAAAGHVMGCRLTAAQAVRQIARGHSLERMRGGALLAALLTCSPEQPTPAGPAARSVRDALAPRICDTHGGWLAQHCPACRRASLEATA